MVTIRIFVEGGAMGNRNLNSECRRGFREFFKKLNIISTTKTTIVIEPCGGRTTAFSDFRKGLKNLKTNEYCLLLIDSEAPIKDNLTVWQHVGVRAGDNWQKPDNATDDHLHFMVECMEAWFMADKETLARYYGKDFNQNALKNTPIEAITKSDLINTLKIATRNTTAGEYSKGGHSYKLLAQLNAKDVVAPSNYYANRLYNTIQKYLT